MIAKLLAGRKLGEHTLLTLHAPEIAAQARPGQFVEIKISGGPEAPFWRRPFSICRAQKARIELLIKPVGKGSAWLAQCAAGARLDLLGPLGNGFSTRAAGSALLVGGGFGVAPLFFLADRLRKQKRDVELFIGGRCREDLLLREESRKLGAEVSCSTDDGSFGHNGRVTELLQRRLEKMSGRVWIAACGPKPMLKAVAELARKKSIPAQLSLEERMACGLGVCNGCVVKADGRYQRVCQDGPVFQAGALEWEDA